MAITALPVLNRTDATFKADVDTFFGTELPQFSIEAEAARIEINANTATASAAAATATTQADLATTNGATQVALATTQANNSATSASLAQQAALSAGSIAWVSGTTYAVGDLRYSPIDFQSYRRITAGSGTTDPSLDLVNWKIAVETGASLLRSTRTSNTILGVSDKGKLIDITSGTFTQTFDTVLTLEDGWFCYLKNSGVGTITLDPFGSELIDGMLSANITPGETRLIQCNSVGLTSVTKRDYPTQAQGNIIITSSITWSAPHTGFYEVIVVGGGGGGGAIFGDRCCAAGGAAGGYARKSFFAGAGQQFSAVIGSGGWSISTATADAISLGGTGGTTSFAGNGLNISASGGGGGGGGIAADTNYGVSTGGSASGGDINITGGGSGNASRTGLNNHRVATGGGAVGVFGVGYSSGNAYSSVGVSASTGGAGVGGASGNATATAANTSTYGGSSGSASVSKTNATATTGDAGTSRIYGWIDGVGTTTTGPGAGSYRPNGDGTPAKGGIFAGGGGGATFQTGARTADSGGIGGGGGGCAGMTVSATSGAGGAGLIVILF